MARAIARGENRAWMDKAAGFALVPHAVFYLRAEVQHLISRVVVGRGAFDYWESGLDIGFGPNMYDSFVRYQARLIRVFDSLAVPYGFEVIDATRPPVEVFESLRTSVSRIFETQEKPKAGHRRKSAQPVAATPTVTATARGD
jgi:dTMP kinase